MPILPTFCLQSTQVVYTSIRMHKFMQHTKTSLCLEVEVVVATSVVCKSKPECIPISIDGY